MYVKEKLDISKYFVVGPENTNGRPVERMIKAVVDAGFTCIQIRSKEASAIEMINLVKKSADIIAEAGKSDEIALLVDDRLDVVLAARELDVYKRQLLSNSTWLSRHSPAISFIFAVSMVLSLLILKKIRRLSLGYASVSFHSFFLRWHCPNQVTEDFSSKG